MAARRHVFLPDDDDSRLRRLVAAYRRGPSWVICRALEALEQQRSGDSEEVRHACEALRRAGFGGSRRIADIERSAGAAPPRAATEG